MNFLMLLLNIYQMCLTAEEKFSIIISSEIKPITDALGNYVYRCLKKRYDIQTLNTSQSTDTNL